MVQMTSDLYQPLNADEFQIRLLCLHPRLATGGTYSSATVVSSDEDQPIAPNKYERDTVVRNRTQSHSGSSSDNEEQYTSAKQHSNITPLHGTLRTVTLDDAPPYIGLSYVWGSEANKKSFVIDGHRVHITKNLAVALEHIQEDTEVLLWIDALCINQLDTQEKSIQVLRMREIYAAAEFTLVWLGPSAGISDILMDYFEASSRKCIDMGGVPTTLWGSTGIMDTVKNHIDINPHMLNHYKQPHFQQMIKGYQDLVTRDWWSRVWVMQEFVVAKEVYFQCGSKRSKLDVFEFSVTSIGPQSSAEAEHLASTHDWLQLLRERQLDAFHESFIANAANAMFLERHHYQGVSGRSRPRLADLLVTFNSLGILDTRLKANDPRDKIYAPLGLASDFDALKITPDYTKSVEEIYTEATTKILANGDLFYLQLCQYDLTSVLPSWVPDLRRDLKWSPNNSRTIDRPFCASGNRTWTNPPRPLESNPRTLEIEACLIGRVKNTGDFLTTPDNDPIPSLPTVHHFILQIDAFLREAAALEDCPYGASSQDVETFEPDWFEPAQYRIPVTDKEISFDDPSRIGRVTTASKARCESLLEVIFAYNAAVKSQSDHKAVTTLSAKLQSNVGVFGKYMTLVANNVSRRPFITENGYVGVGPKSIEKGDEVIVFLGADTPHILRAIDGTKGHVLVGDAYVHGVMDGEFMEGHPIIEVLQLI